MSEFDFAKVISEEHIDAILRSEVRLRQQILKEVLDTLDKLGNICEGADLGDEVRIVDIKHALKERFGDGK